METKPKNIRELSRTYQRLETLMNRVNYDSLLKEHKSQSRKKATGIDEVTKELYEENLDENLKDLMSRLKSFSYKPKPVRRTYIPKANGKLRPLGIPSYEDKLVQGVMADILNDIYEPRFNDCSYGFRENRCAHDAIRDINQAIMTQRVNYILDLDIKGFFDNVDHKWLMTFLENDIADKNFLRYIKRFLKAGIMEDDTLKMSDKGTPQGGLISPILANVYLHYVLDEWFYKKVLPSLNGYARLVRFADDFIIMFEYEDEAMEVYTRLVSRLKTFNLEIEEDKKTILPFGRFKGTKMTFDFAGFTHYNSKTRTNKYTIGRRVSKKKRKQFKTNLNQWLKSNRHLDTHILLDILDKKITGAFRYYGISGMFNELKYLYHYARFKTFKWLNRRSQRKSFSYDKFCKVWNKCITKPMIHKNIWLWNA